MPVFIFKRKINVMPRRLLFLLLCLVCASVSAQDSAEQIMEKRAKELYRVLGLSDKESYKKFMKENYTKEFLEKPIKLNRMVSESDGGSATTSAKEEKALDNLDAKAQMYAQLHEDFGGSKLESLKRTDNKIEMQLKSVGLKGKFTLTFNKEKPYLIEGMGIEADMEN
jgi:hypothetical protein